MSEQISQNHILIVEDERLTAADLEASLRGLGYDVVANVASGKQAIASADKFRPAVVIMDIRLRGPINGIEAASVIRQQWRIPIVYLSAYVDDAKDLEGACIRKPFTVGALRAALESVLPLAA